MHAPAGHIMSQSLEQLTDDTWRKRGSAGLSDKQAADLAALAFAGIKILTADHFIQYRRQLVSTGRRLGHTWLYAPLRGSVAMEIEGQRWVVSPNDVALIPAGAPHGAVALTKRFEVVTIHMRILLEGSIPDPRLFQKPVFRLPNPAAWHRHLEMVVSLECEPCRAQSGVAILRYLLMSLVTHGEALTPSRSGVDPRIARALSLMAEGLKNRPLLNDIRQEVGLGHSHFNRLFRQATDMTPRAFQKGLRMQGVLNLLREPRLSIKQIAARLGYFDTQHLEREFKAEFGMPPGAFRQDSSRLR